MPRLTKEQHLEIIEKYKTGALCSELAEEYGVDRTSISSMLDRKGILKHDSSYVYRRASGHFLNENVFDTVNPESAYWMGFLMADAAVVGNIVALCLASQDSHHLYKFREFVEGSQEILEVNKGQAFRYAFQSQYVVKALARHGVVSKKTFIAKASDGLTTNKHFWRGVCDGDGSIGIYLHLDKLVPRFELCGSLDLMTQASKFLLTLDISSNVHKSKNIYRIQVNGTLAAKVINHLYSDEPSLDRKATIVYSIYEWSQSRGSRCARDFPSCIG